MNKQRKVLITITYNEMGIIIDTKAEEVAQPVAKDINVLCTDTISRQAAIDAILTWDKFGCDERGRLVPWGEGLVPYVHLEDVARAIANLPSAQPKDYECWGVQLQKDGSATF